MRIPNTVDQSQEWTSVIQSQEWIDYVNKRRKKLDISRNKLCELAEISPATLWKALNAKGATPRTVRLINAALDRFPGNKESNRSKADNGIHPNDGEQLILPNVFAESLAESTWPGKPGCPIQKDRQQFINSSNLPTAVTASNSREERQDYFELAKMMALQILEQLTGIREELAKMNDFRSKNEG